MDEKFIRDKITSLRLKKNISEYKLSLDLGHSKGYIQGISSGRSLPSLGEFLYMCEYFGITPKEFFDEEIENPMLVQKLYSIAKDMSEEDLCALIGVAEQLNKK
ncbi:MAG: helix-turn-helix transcriptional regulator [Ruminococcaceae bacterium]|nr:helix-turn-helix transcriptional regulator [Oscillospiraceae bacterium]